MMNLKNAFQKTINDDWTFIDNHRKAVLFMLVVFLPVAFFFQLAIPAFAALILTSFFVQLAFNGFFNSTDADIAPLSHLEALSDELTALQNKPDLLQQQLNAKVGANRALQNEKRVLEETNAALQLRFNALSTEHAHLGAAVEQLKPHMTAVQAHILAAKRTEEVKQQVTVQVTTAISSISAFLQSLRPEEADTTDTQNNAFLLQQLY